MAFEESGPSGGREDQGCVELEGAELWDGSLGPLIPPPLVPGSTTPSRQLSTPSRERQRGGRDEMHQGLFGGKFLPGRLELTSTLP